jgi:hypothetical protein
MKIHTVIFFSLSFEASNGFHPHAMRHYRFVTKTSRDHHYLRPRSSTCTHLTAEDEDKRNDSEEEKKIKQADVMAFLRKKGAVGKNKDFSTAMGVDEGPVGKNKSQGKPYYF